MTAIERALPGRQFVPPRLGVVRGGGSNRRVNGYRGYSPLRSLRNTLILGTVAILVLLAYSLGASINASPSRAQVATQQSGGYVSYLVRPGDSPWSIASRVAPNPAAVPGIASAITSMEGGAALTPGTVLYIAQ